MYHGVQISDLDIALENNFDERRYRISRGKHPTFYDSPSKAASAIIGDKAIILSKVFINNHVSYKLVESQCDSERVPEFVVTI